MVWCLDMGQKDVSSRFSEDVQRRFLLHKKGVTWNHWQENSTAQLENSWTIHYCAFSDLRSMWHFARDGKLWKGWSADLNLISMLVNQVIYRFYSLQPMDIFSESSRFTNEVKFAKMQGQLKGNLPWHYAFYFMCYIYYIHITCIIFL